MRKITTSAYIPTEIQVENLSETVAKIIAYPFETGYGVTVAHPLRRLLYTSTVGYAPTAIKIDGIAHEFDSLRGMFEDVAVFIINLKNLRFKLKGDSARETITYEFAGPKVIKGKDLNNDVVEIVTPDGYLATINEDANLRFTIVVEKGIGYVPSEEIRDYIDKDYIALDAFFTPVKRANYDIDNVLVEDNPDYERITFTITTDGQITPAQAFKNALESLYQQLSVFAGLVDVTPILTTQSQSSSSAHSKLFESVESLNLSARSFNCLDKANIQLIGEVAIMEESELKELKNLGKRSLDEIKSVMEEIGYPIGSAEILEKKEQFRKKFEEIKNEKKDK